MSSKSGYTKKILRILGQKPATSLESLKKAEEPKTSYALTRSLKNLVESGYAQIQNSDNQQYVRLTKKGRTRLDVLRLEGVDALVPTAWDGYWRIVILDIPEERKSEREGLRYLLKKADFVCVKNTVWISPYPYENIFMNIKKDLGFTTELMILVTDKLDSETRLAFLEAIKS